MFAKMFKPTFYVCAVLATSGCGSETSADAAYAMAGDLKAEVANLRERLVKAESRIDDLENELADLIGVTDTLRYRVDDLEGN